VDLLWLFIWNLNNLINYFLALEAKCVFYLNPKLKPEISSWNWVIDTIYFEIQGTEVSDDSDDDSDDIEFDDDEDEDDEDDDDDDGVMGDAFVSNSLRRLDRCVWHAGDKCHLTWITKGFSY